jgi:hypothetical protein
MLNSSPSGTRHPGLFIWVTAKGVIHAADSQGVVAYARAQKPHLVAYNIHMLVGDQTYCKPGADHTQKQIVKYGLQDWYRVRWLTTSDGRVVFPVVGDAAFFTENHPHHGLCPKVLQALLNGSKSISRNDKMTCRLQGSTIHAVPPRSYHWLRLPAPPDDALLCPAKYGLLYASDFAMDRVAQQVPPPPPPLQAGTPPPLVWDPPPLLAPHTHGMRSHRAAFFAQFHFHQYATIPASIHPSAAMQVSPALTTN